jgi:eukaryotic-like serine/threonine-protein kinase
MNGAASDRATAIFFGLSQLPPDQHAAVIEQQCGNDPLLRHEVEQLLAGLERPEVPTPTPFPNADDSDGVAQPAGAVIGDFVVIRQIGAGGTGVVYLAHQRHPPRVVALKLLRREFMASAVQRRFEIEAELLAHLQHAGIAQIYAAHPGDEKTPPFIAMELVNGPPLTEFADRESLNVRDRVELMARVSDAVQHAHQRGVIHRDLKPGNILVNEHGEPKVLDFGVARRVAEVSPTTIATETGQLIGTLAYMSPEQVLAVPGSIDTRTDIHALGVILFRMLAGRLPFGHDDPPLPELARRIVQDDAPRLGAVKPDLRGDLEIIVARALAKEKERRYPSASALSADLRRYLAGEPISASADSAWYVVRRQLGRYRLALAVSAATLVAVTALAFYAILQRSRADQTNADLEHELTTSTIERGRLSALSGNQPVAEGLVWRELFKNPESQHARWTLWELYSREPSLWTRVPHNTGTHSIRFSPDGRWLATGGRADGVVHLVDPRTGEVRKSLTSSPTSGIRRAHFAPDGRSIVAGHEDGSIRFWDPESGTLIREFPQLAPGLVEFAVTGRREYIVIVAKGIVRTFSMATGALVADLTGIVPPSYSVAANESDTVAFIGSDDGTITAVDAVRRLKLWQHRPHLDQVSALDISPDGRTLVSGSIDEWIYFWDTATGARRRTIRTENGRVRNVWFNHTGTALGSTGYWKSLVWDLTQPTPVERSVGGSEGMTDLDFSPDGRSLVTAQGGGGWVRLWNLAADGRAAHWSGHRGIVSGVAVDDDGASFYTSGADGVVAKWRTSEDRLATLVNADKITYGFDRSDNGEWMVLVGEEGAASVWDARGGRKLTDLPGVKQSRSVLFVDNDRRIVIGEIDGTLKIFPWVNGEARAPVEVKTTHTEVLAMVARGSRFFIAHRDQTVLERDLASSQEVRTIKTVSSPFSVALSADARVLAIGTWLGAVEVWDLNAGKPLDSAKGPTALIHSVDISPDGQMIAIGSRDGTTRLWHIPTRQWLATVAARPSGAEMVLFLADGKRLVIGYEDGEVEVRDLDYFFRYVAGNAEYQLRLLNAAGESFPRAQEVIEWSRKVLQQ